MITDSEMLYYLHWLELFQTCLFGYFVFTIVGVVFEMTYICYVADITYTLSVVSKPSDKYIKRYGRACVPQMGVAVYCRSAYV